MTNKRKAALITQLAGEGKMAFVLDGDREYEFSVGSKTDGSFVTKSEKRSTSVEDISASHFNRGLAEAAFGLALI